jgi:hypothetical protein
LTWRSYILREYFDTGVVLAGANLGPAVPGKWIIIIFQNSGLARMIEA